MKKNRVQTKLLEELEKTPIIQRACDRCDISRNTYYRWCKENPDFKCMVEERLKMAIDLVNDAAESNILQGIKNGDRGSTQFWLTHRHPAYKKRYSFFAPPKETENLALREIAKKKAQDMADRWTKGKNQPA